MNFHADLSGKRILVVEDEAMLALDLAYAVEDAGADVIGPCFTLDMAVEAASATAFDAAVLDVDLAGSPVFPLADILTESKIPFIFYTARRDPGALAARYAGARVCEKPSSTETVVRTLSSMLQGPPAA